MKIQIPHYLGLTRLLDEDAGENPARNNKKRHTVKVCVVSGDVKRLFQPCGLKRTRVRPPGPLLAQGVNLPEVSGRPGAESSALLQ